MAVLGNFCLGSIAAVIVIRLYVIIQRILKVPDLRHARKRFGRDLPAGLRFSRPAAVPGSRLRRRRHVGLRDVGRQQLRSMDRSAEGKR